MKNYRYPPDSTLTHKFCKGCGIEHPISEFSLASTNRDGYQNKCKSAFNLIEKQRYEKNSDKRKKQSLDYYYSNPEKIKISRQERHKVNMKEDPLYKVKRNLRNRLWYALYHKNWKKDCHFADYIGCSSQELINHIENQWSEGMNWDNYGSIWEIDHISPLSLAESVKAMEDLCHYKNLRPLLKILNRQKSNKIVNFESYKILSITYEMYNDFLQETHYLTTHSGCKFYYGLFYQEELVGVCGYGTPSMPHIAGSFVQKEYEHLVLELKRFALKNNLPNEGSFFLSSTLRMLSSGQFVITYADPSQGHEGTLYKACNFISMGLTRKNRNYFIKGKENLHPRSLEKYTNDETGYVERVQKHRFLFITGNSTTKKRLLKNIKIETGP